MGWKGAVRAIAAASRRAQREERRRFQALQRRTEEYAKLSAIEQARAEVEYFDGRLGALLSIHKDQEAEVNWKQLSNTPPPIEPTRENRHANSVEVAMAWYKPGFFDKVFGKAKKQALAFEAQLQAARQKDEDEFQAAWAQFQSDYADWQDQRSFAQAVIDGDGKSYKRALTELSPFSEFSELGSSLEFQIHSPKLVEVTLKVNGEKAIPSESVSLTSSGKLTTKAIPKGRFHEMYQDYVCGCVLRVGREVHALLPTETVMVTALADIFDSRTGITNELPILSVAMPRRVMKSLNFNLLDPSDAMENFQHRGDMKGSRKAGRFSAIVPLTPTEVWASTGANTQVIPSHDPASAGEPAPRNSNPFPGKWSEALRKNEIHHGFLKLTANELANLLGRRPQSDFTLSESKGLVAVVESFGYCLEPDPHGGCGRFEGNTEIGIFQPPSGSVQPPTSSYLGASALLQLFVMVASADGTVDRGEIDRFRLFIEDHFEFTPDEHQRLVVLETLYARNPAMARGTVSRIARRVPQEKTLTIGKFLVEVAATDGTISLQERKALGKIFDAFRLKPEVLEWFLADNDKRHQGTKVTEAISETVSPTPANNRTSGLIQLDMNRVAAISAETREVVEILAAAMSDTSGAVDVMKVSDSVPIQGEAEKGAKENEPVTSKFSALDPKLIPVVKALLTRNEWGRVEFDALARERMLMPLGAYDGINEWADEHLGEFLLEGEDPIRINRSLLSS